VNATAEIILNDGSNVVIDADDMELLGKHSWYAHYIKGSCYAQTSTRGRAVSMSRLIMNEPVGMEVDHVNHDTRDNRKENLRICSHRQNMMNQAKQKGRSSQFKGVSWNKGRKLWKAYIWGDNRQELLGYFVREEDAASVYDKKAQELFWTYAQLNGVTP
jgi:hypothetical protein